MVSPNGLDLLATLVGIHAALVGLIFLVAGQSTRAAFVTILGGGILAGLVEVYALLIRMS